MIEIINKTDVQYVFYPKTQNSTGPYTLHIHSELSQKDWHFENVEDKASLHDYYKFLVDYSNVDDGEFNYQIISNEEVMDTGLLRIGIGQANVKGYDTPNEIIQYDMYGAPTERYQHKSISATSNGTYNVLPDEDYVALSEVDVYVNVPSDSGASYESGYTQGYESGYTQGSEDGYGSGYTKGTADGFGSGYTSGKTDGIAEQKAKLVATAVTSNGTYSRPDGYSSIQVSIPQTGHTDEEMQQAYASGKTDGIAEQKAKLVATAFTQNGTYARNDGWNSVVIDVSGYTEQDLLDAFNSGYTNGYNSGNTDGYESGWTDGYISGYTDGSGQTATTATALTLNVPASITGSGQASVSVEPLNAHTNITYTSSDPTVATISSSGTINVYSAGNVTITVTDSISQLTDSETINVEPYSGLTTPLTVDVISAGTILWVAGRNASAKTIEYQVNDGEWTSITSTTAGTPINVIAGDVVRLRGNNNQYGASGDDKANHLLMQTGRYGVKGNIMSLIDSTNYVTSTTFGNYAFLNFFKDSIGLVDITQLILPATGLTQRCYCDMFASCTNLSSTLELPAATLAEECCLGMFYGCTSLATAYALPATALARRCYDSMFENCTALTTVPSILPATTLAENCYAYMFNGCTSLTTAPSLPATTLANSCYSSMFNGCTSLTAAPSLPATTLADYCYTHMFQGCTSLTQAPELPATVLGKGCYTYMFQGCTSLTAAPELPATALTEGCYAYMFQMCSNLIQAPTLQAPILAKQSYQAMFAGCTSLNQITCLAIDKTAQYCTDGWVSSVSSSGTFVKDPNISESTWGRGNNGIPTGWTVVDAQ